MLGTDDDTADCTEDGIPLGKLVCTGLGTALDTDYGEQLGIALGTDGTAGIALAGLGTALGTDCGEQLGIALGTDGTAGIALDTDGTADGIEDGESLGNVDDELMNHLAN